MKLYLSRLLCFILAFAATGAVAQDNPDLKDMSLHDLLNVKVTTATKTLQEQNLAPAKVIVITKDQIRTRNYQSLLDLILDLPGFKVDDKIYSGSRNSVTIRGIQGQQNFFILLDGVKISSPTNEALPIMENYPVHLAEQVEIVYGPSSALYGADAVSGVINIITRKLPDGKGFVADASASAGMYGATNNTLYMAKRFNDKTAFVLSGQYYYDRQPDLSEIYADDSLLSVAHYSTGTFNTMFGPMTPSAPVTPKYEAPTMAYNVYAALQMGDLRISGFSNHTRIPNSWGNNTHNAVYNKDVNMGQSVSELASAYRKVLGNLTSSTTFSGAFYQLKPSSNYRNLYSGMEPVYKYSMSFSGKAEQQFDYSVSKKLGLTGGVSHERFSTIPQSPDLIKPVNTEMNIEGTWPGTVSHYRPEGIDAKIYQVMYHNSGVYLQGQYAMNRKLNFTLGARYDYNSRYKETFNPRLGVVYKATSRTTIKALYGSAFMAPPPSTAYVAYGSFETQDSGKTYSSSFLHLPNPGLGPITSKNFELSIRQYLTNNLVVTVDGFYTNIKGLVTFADDNQTTKLYNNSFMGVPVGYIEVFINDRRQENYGGSMQINYKNYIGNVFLNSLVSVSYVNGKRSSSASSPTGHYHTELEFISPFMLRAGTEATLGKFTFSPRLILTGRQNLPGIQDTVGHTIRLQTLPGYALLNIALRYDLAKWISVFGNVTNALDQRYRAVGYNMDLNKTNTDVLHGQPQDPFRATIGVNFSLTD